MVWATFQLLLSWRDKVSGVARSPNQVKSFFKAVAASAVVVAKVSGVPALTKCLTPTFFRGTFFVLVSTKIAPLQNAG